MHRIHGHPLTSFSFHLVGAHDSTFLSPKEWVSTFYPYPYPYPGFIYTLLLGFILAFGFLDLGNLRNDVALPAFIESAQEGAAFGDNLVLAGAFGFI